MTPTGGTRFVLDCSVAMGWCFSDERSDPALEILARLANERALVTAYFSAEVTNVLVQAERRKRIKSADADAFLAFMQALSIDESPRLANDRSLAVLRLSRRTGLTAYDAGYLELALHEGLALATLDRELVKAARAEGVRSLLDI